MTSNRFCSKRLCSCVSSWSIVWAAKPKDPDLNADNLKYGKANNLDKPNAEDSTQNSTG